MSWDAIGIRAKVDRVNVNLDSFRAALGAYLADDPYTISAELDSKSGWHMVYVEPDQPPPIFGLIIGEAVHNLRSALDHIAWQLANLDGPPPDPDGVQFPIFSPDRKPPSFVKHRSVNGMRKGHVAVLEHLQPYNADNRSEHGNLMEMLAWLSNTDKHRLVHTTASHAQEFIPHFIKARRGYVIQRSEFGYTGLLEGRTEIGRLLVAPASLELQVDMQFAPTIGISFGDEDAPMYGWAADGALRLMQEMVGLIVDAFDRPGASGAPPWPT